MKRTTIVMLSLAVSAPLFAQEPKMPTATMPEAAKRGAPPAGIDNNLPPELKAPKAKQTAPGPKREIPHVRTLTIVGGQKVNAVYQGVDPMPAETFDVLVDRGGPEVVKEGNGFRFNWALEIAPKRASIDLTKTPRVTLEEVSGKNVITLFSGKPEIDGKKVVIFAPGDLITRDRYPWLYQMRATTFIFRIRLEPKEGAPIELIQPMRITRSRKQLYREAGVLGDVTHEERPATAADRKP